MIFNTAMYIKSINKITNVCDKLKEIVNERVENNHKTKNFTNNPKCRLMNPAKLEIGKVGKLWLFCIRNI